MTLKVKFLASWNFSRFTSLAYERLRKGMRLANESRHIIFPSCYDIRAKKEKKTKNKKAREEKIIKNIKEARERRKD